MRWHQSFTCEKQVTRAVYLNAFGGLGLYLLDPDNCPLRYSRPLALAPRLTPPLRLSFQKKRVEGCFQCHSPPDPHVPAVKGCSAGFEGRPATQRPNQLHDPACQPLIHKVDRDHAAPIHGTVSVQNTPDEVDSLALGTPEILPWDSF